MSGEKSESQLNSNFIKQPGNWGLDLSNTSVLSASKERITAPHIFLPNTPILLDAGRLIGQIEASQFFFVLGKSLSRAQTPALEWD